MLNDDKTYSELHEVLIYILNDRETTTLSMTLQSRHIYKTGTRDHLVWLLSTNERTQRAVKFFDCDLTVVERIEPGISML